MKLSKVYLLLSITAFISCNNSFKGVEEIEKISKIIKKQHAPDSRVAIYNIDITSNSKDLILKGETDSKEALQQLLDSLSSKKITYKNHIRILPDSAVGNKKYAVGNNSVINIRSKPKHSAELGTQGLLGMDLKVLDKKGDFYRVQTPDNYISWVDKGGIKLMTLKELNQWEKEDKIIYTSNSGYVYQQKNDVSSIVSDIVFGGILGLKKEHTLFYEVQYPDNRIGFVKKTEAISYTAWLHKNPSNADFIETTARTFLGAPYLWGGTSTKGVDCSGFTKTVYLMIGLIIPRDASQQVTAGKIIDENLKFEGLQKGDLLFFGRKATNDKKQRVTHVGIWLGNGKGEFIHSSGKVHLSSINEDQPNYDEFNKNRYLGSRRYLDVDDDKIIDLKKVTTIKH